MSRYYEVAINKIIRAGSDFFTYACDEEAVGVGSLVMVPIGRAGKIEFGVVFREVGKPKYACKKIEQVLCERRLPKHLVDAMVWMSNFYNAPLSLILQSVIPANVVKNIASFDVGKKNNVVEKTRDILLNDEQKKAIAAICKNKSPTILLHGITGSGKTNVYLELTRRTLATGKSVIVLVPEIALTSQLIEKFREVFGSSVVEIHSQQTATVRRKIWQTVFSSDEPMIVVGPRSALFAPVDHLGLVVVDEAHEPSYRQDSTPKYNALRLASFMASDGGFKAFFGTATPLVVDYMIARQKEAIIELKNRAIQSDDVVKITTTSLKDRCNFSKHRFLSDDLLSSIEKSLSRGKQALIFHNRRGSSNLIACETCGFQALCPDCRLPLTLHHDSFQMICHLCGKKWTALTKCPDCQSPKVVYKGFGTKAVEEELKKLFPAVKIARFDSDTAKDQTMNRLYEQVKNGEFGIIIGTQSIAKGFDLPNLTTVGVLQADSGLFMPDFTASERTFELLTQVIGRVGRGHADAEVIIQTYQPDDEIIQLATEQNYEDFAKITLAGRKKSGYPPFCHLLKLVCSMKTESLVVKNVREAARIIASDYPALQVLGPAPAFYEFSRGDYRWQITVKAKRRGELLELLKKLNLPPANWQVDLDPYNLL
ncbi:MAG: primosomal protein N' [Candidatus Nomurabacteria bacterium]|jgi:primosomal protein N' (replication factor Y)|nr:primosomal protein N' [Candidatus Nomurabacteria bacterium]